LLIAAEIGVLFGVVDATSRFLYRVGEILGDHPGVAGTHVFLVMLTNRVLMMTGVACALAFALAVLRELSQRAAIRPRDVALTIVAVAAVGWLVVSPIALGDALAVHSWLHLPGNPLEGAPDWVTVLSRTYADTGERVSTFVATVTLSAIYYLKDSRTADALGIAQLGLSQAQKRRLTEELRSAQAALDPEFVFATMAEVDRRFDSEPQVAQHLVESLIRYLRAALPAHDEAIGTLAQQATLVCAYLEIEANRCAGRLQWEVEVPSELGRRPFAPALILPLVALAVGGAAGSGRDTQIRVKASLAGSRLAVEVRGEGGEPAATGAQETTLAALRDRVGALYGSNAELSFAIHTPRGSTAKIVIDDPGAL
jgi:hypothetical protein